jgi:(R,R)-butanediol dehydrogenase/meso-butanediol dehydrogenase/diacetyl reductase
LHVRGICCTEIKQNKYVFKFFSNMLETVKASGTGPLTRLATGKEVASVQALRSHGLGLDGLKVDVIEGQTCGESEVRVAVAYCGICGSDLHEAIEGYVQIPLPGTCHKHTGIKVPVTLGHEMSGVVTEVGEKVSSLSVGQKVAVNPLYTCGHFGLDPCESCEKRRTNICKETAVVGYSTPGGGFSTQLVIPESNAFVLPENIPLEVGALVEPLAVAWHAVRMANIRPGQNALILGAGPIGLALLQILKVWGVNKVIITEVLETRTKQAHRFGSDLVINPLEKDHNGNKISVSQKVKEFLNGEPVDVSYDASGSQSTLDTALETTGIGGQIIYMAIQEHPLKIIPHTLTMGKRPSAPACVTQIKIFQKQ